MNKYFTKEYIKECDCKEIQGLRRDFWIYGDRASIDKKNVYLVITQTGKTELNKDEIFIPAGDQLDEEIVKLCKKDKLVYKVIHYSNGIIKAFIYNSDSKKGEPIYTKRAEFQVSDVCLIAKIRILKELLLKELLKESEEK